MAIKYLAGNRIQGTNTERTDLAVSSSTDEDLQDETWTSSDSDLTQGSSYVRIATTENANDRIYYDIGTANISDTWTLKAKVVISNYTSGNHTHSRWVNLGLSSSNADMTGTFDSINMVFRTNTSIDSIAATRSNGQQLTGQLGTAGISGVTLGNGTFYCELERVNATDYTMKVRSGSHSGTLLGTGSYTDAASTLTGLRYIVAGRIESQGGGDFTTQFEEIDLTTNTTDESLVNLESNSIFEESNTGKHYIRDPTVINYEDVVYNTDTADDVTISGNTATKGSAGAGWNRGFVRSTQSISPSTGGGEVKWTMSRVYAMAGLDKGTAWSGSGTTYPTVEYALYPTDVYESGTDVGATVSTSTDAHIYKITMDSAGLVKYYVDGTLVHTSTVTASGTYYFAAMPYDTSDFVTGEIATASNKGGWVLVN